MSTTEKILFGSLLLLIGILPFREGNNYDIQAVTQIILLGCAALWGVSVIRRGHAQILIDPVDWWVFGFTVWALFSLAASEYKYATLLELIKFLSYLTVFYLGRTLFPLGKHKNLLLFAILGSGVFHACLAWGFKLTGKTRMLQADFINPNLLAGFLLFGVNIALAFVLFADRQPGTASKPPSVGAKILVALALIMLTITIFDIHSRGATISFAMTGMALTVLRKRRLALLFLALFLVVLFFPSSNGSLFQRLRKQDDIYAYERVNIWKSSARLALDHPLFGVSPGMFNDYIRPYNFPVEQDIARYGKNINVAHNELLQIAVEMGLPGLFLFLGGLAALGYYSFRHIRQPFPDWRMMAASAALLGLFIVGMVSNLLISAVISIMAFMLATILIDGTYAYSTSDFQWKPRLIWGLLGALLCVGVLLYVIVYPLMGHWSFLRHNEFMHAKDDQNAAASLQSAIDWAPLHAGYHYSMGLMSLNAFRRAPAGDTFQKAERALRRAIWHNPRNYQYYETLGILYRELGETNIGTPDMLKRALDAYQRAHEYNPLNPFLIFAMASLHADLEEFDQAIVQLQRAITFEPNFVGGHQMLGRLLAHVGRQAEADAEFRMAQVILDRYKTVPTFSQYATALLRPLNAK